MSTPSIKAGSHVDFAWLMDLSHAASIVSKAVDAITPQLNALGTKNRRALLAGVGSAARASTKDLTSFLQPFQRTSSDFWLTSKWRGGEADLNV
jgi:hypothetical protein